MTNGGNYLRKQEGNDKHLFTLHPSISGNPTNEMRANSLLLVLPRQLEETYTHN
ncbi:MAG: hypothetical protein IPL31_17815 [Saprospiraceae bacterium]|nr:hypothetical protein [Saprospiraceae bacterium]